MHGLLSPATHAGQGQSVMHDIRGGATQSRMAYGMPQNDLKTWPFKVKAGEDDGPCLEVEYKGKPHTMRPEQISGHILTRLKETAENYLGKQVILRPPCARMSSPWEVGLAEL